MIDIGTWTAFALASAALLAIPGPTVMLAVSYALGRGARTAWATVPGVTLGDFTAMSVSLAGAGAVLAASAELFTVLKLAGAAYLVWLGIGLWRADAVLAEPPATRAPGDMRRMAWQAYVVTALNPKSIVFFVAFVPQFMDPARAFLPQAAVLVGTFCALAAVNILLWALAAGEMRRRLARPAVLRALTRTGGGLLVCAGLLTALMRRPA